MSMHQGSYRKQRQQFLQLMQGTFRAPGSPLRSRPSENRAGQGESPAEGSKDPLVYHLGKRVGKLEMQLMNERRKFNQLSLLVQSLRQTAGLKRVKNQQLSSKCENFPLEEVMDLEQQKAARATAAQLNEARIELARAVQEEETGLIKTKHELQMLRASLTISVRRKRNDCEDAHIILQEKQVALSELQSQLQAINHLKRAKLADPAFQISRNQKLLQKAKSQYEQAFDQHELLTDKLSALQLKLPEPNPHLAYVKGLEQELGKFYFQIIGEAEEGEAEVRQLARRAQQLRGRQRGLQGQMSREMGRMNELLQKLNTSAGR